MDGRNWVSWFQKAPWLVFVLGIAFFVLMMTNFIMNVAAIAITLPVSLVIARYLGVAPEVILFASLATAGMPFNLLIGAAPNAIAYESKQFTRGRVLLLRLDSQHHPDGLSGGILLLYLAAARDAGLDGQVSQVS